MARQAPLRTRDELESATAEQIAAQFRWEVRRLIDVQDWSQLDLAIELGYSTGYLSRWLNERESIPQPAAERLDNIREGLANGALSLADVSYAELHGRWRAARHVAQQITTEYDVFVASPMASAAEDDGYGAERGTALEVVDALQHYCGFHRVYYAGTTIESRESFESPTLSLELNASALRDSRYFMLLALNPPVKPSGVYVEAGMALAMGKPSVYFVRASKQLPWMLQTIGEHRSRLLPRVSIEPVESMRAAVGRLRKHRSQLFKRLDVV
ncbi:MAG TPA: helix-turn-helix transcriptional regulator [Conexibacter sp.]|nr:helix-turn-helix transcriptional regulator [Conexibacter sp.]